jgi:ethanolamine utilization protein EutP (predicted NTPase)
MEPKLKLLICGKSGSGKTTLLRELLGSDVISEDKISHAAPMTVYFDQYEKGDWTVFDSKGYESGDSLKDFVSTLKGFIGKHNGFDHKTYIHNILYCIDGSGARVTNFDLEILRAFQSQVIVLLTKTDIAKYTEIYSMTKELEKNNIPSSNILRVSSVSRSGFTDLERFLHLNAPAKIEQAKNAATDEKLYATASVGIAALITGVAYKVFKTLGK